LKGKRVFFKSSYFTIGRATIDEFGMKSEGEDGRRVTVDCCKKFVMCGLRLLRGERRNRRKTWL
jgi:hypothetical protein